MDALFEAVDAAVDAAERAGMYIIIDNHTSCCTKYNPELVRIFWDIVAPRYKDRTHVIYEIQNEPVSGFGGFRRVADIRFQEDMFHYVRQRAPDTHIILWSFAKITETSKDAVDKAGSIDYRNASVGVHPYGVISQKGDFQYLRALQSEYPVLITEFSNILNVDTEKVWDFAESQGISWVYLDLRDRGNLGDGVADPEEWPVTWSGDPACVEARQAANARHLQEGPTP
jgi:hypothetical protein